jgi:MFS family permease
MTARPGPYAALHYRDFRLLLMGQLITALGNQMVSFAVGWELWLRTRSALALGLVGLVQVIPVMLFALPAGHLADRYPRKRIVLVTQGLLAVCAIGLGVLSLAEGPLALMYLCLFGIGLARAFNTPAASTLLPQTVPAATFTNAAMWSSSAWQIAAVVGPAAAGLLIATTHRAAWIYLLDGLAAATFVVLVTRIGGQQQIVPRKAATWEALVEGVRFLRSSKVLLAAIALDMFAVLLGGAVALLPLYATDILHVGSEGLGLMRTAPSVGALIMAVVLAHLPPFQRAGWTLLLAVAGFGVATIVFGLSTSFWLSLVMLMLLGGLDNISVVIRSTLLLTHTPDAMRGRTAAVNSIFISASNELGSFESGLVAAWLGPVLAVVSGGIGTLLICLAVGILSPPMRELKTLDAPPEISAG